MAQINKFDTLNDTYKQAIKKKICTLCGLCEHSMYVDKQIESSNKKAKTIFVKCLISELNHEVNDCSQFSFENALNKKVKDNDEKSICRS